MLQSPGINHAQEEKKEHMGHGNLKHGEVLTFLHQWLMSFFVNRWCKSNKLKTLSRTGVVLLHECVCVWGKKVSIIPINHPFPATVSSWYVGELWESLITQCTHTHTLDHYCQQLPSRPCEYPNNIIITSILQQCAPFLSPRPFAPRGTKRNMTTLLGQIPPNHTMGPSTPPCSSHCWAGLWPCVTCQKKVRPSACQWTVAWGGGGGGLLCNEWEACVNMCLWVKKRACVFSFGTFVCLATAGVGL